MASLMRSIIARRAPVPILASSKRAFGTSLILRAESGPGRSSLGTPSPKPSDSPEEGDVKSSRAMDSKSSPDTASLAHPATPGAAQGQDEEGHDPAKQDPNKSQADKARATEQQGQKPLDAANK